MRTTNCLLALILTLTITSQGVAQRYGMGAKFDLEKYNKAELETFRGLGFADDIPSQYSLKMYAPYPGDQGLYGTCVGWASSYGGLTIQYAKAFGWTDRNKITALAFDPWFTYSQLKSADDWTCDGGTFGYDALALLRTSGAKRYYTNRYDCGVQIDQTMVEYGRIHRIKSFKRLFSYPEGYTLADFFQTKIDKANPVKKAVGNGHVVLLSTRLPDSFFWPENGAWAPTAEERATATIANTGGHAMIVVGYDDNMLGGAFEIMNSWGGEWGNAGFVWVRYEDFNWFCREAFYFELFEESLPATGCVSGNCDNGYGRMTFSGGSIYEGEFKSGKYNGYGIYVWPDGSVYAGQWKDDQRHGFATTISTSRFEQTGYWDNDKPVEYAVTVGSSVAEGCISGDCENGYGTFVYGNGSYTGYFSDGYRSGLGTYTFSEGGGKLSGIWSLGKVNGIGRYTWPEGYYFVGEYVFGEKNGYGIEFGNGLIYAAGEWLLGEYIGDDLGFAEGKTAKPSRAMAADFGSGGNGCASGNCQDGYGTFEYDGGDSYVGYFKNGLRSGSGTYYSASGWNYSGSWADGLFDGFGKYTWSDGTYFLGEYRKGKQDGYGIEVAATSYVAGIWEFGTFQPGKTALGFAEGAKGSGAPKEIGSVEADRVTLEWLAKISAMKPETRK